MKKTLFYLIASVIILGASTLFAELIDKVAIVVNDEIITDREIERQLAPIYDRYKMMYSGNQLIEKLEEARQKVAQQMIEDRLLYGEAKKQNIEVDGRDIDAKVQEVVNGLGSRENFDQALIEQQLTLKDLKDRYRQQLMTKRLIDQKIGPGIMITPVEIDNYYNKNLSEFMRPERARIKNILISIKKFPDPQKALTLAKDILKRLREGCEFEGLAKMYSDGPGASGGGDMGYVNKGDLLLEIEKVIFSLKPGEASGIIQTSLGYHIFKVEEREGPKTSPLSEVRRQVEMALYQSKVDNKIKGWIEGLKKSAYIAFK